MNKFKLVICEDNESLKPVLESYCIELQKKYDYLEYEFSDFQTLLKVDNSYENTADLILLDLLDESDTEELLGVRILEIIKNRDIKIPLIVYTSLKDAKGAIINVNDLRRDYPFAVFVQKYDVGQTVVKDELELKIKNKLKDQFEINSDYEDEFNQQLHLLGKSKLNQILFDIKTHYEIAPNKKVELFKLKSGFSGAVLFKFKVENTEYVLKISNDIKLLEDEFSKAEKYYSLFPPKFFNRIETRKFYNSSKDTIAIIIKLIPNSITLLDFILKSEISTDISSIFHEIYFNNGLKVHYETQIRDNISWTEILKKFKNGRFINIIEVYKELKPLLHNFNLSAVKNLIEEDDYNKLNSIKIAHRGTVILNHLDLHSKNILIQGENTPFLIDTGIMDYDYWCFDICRLLADLLINGIDIDKKEFYDIQSIPKNIKLGLSLIQLEPVVYDSKNDRIIDSINWLTANARNIYKDYFSHWEFQLGLMKEFLQISCRTGSVPHSKRALSLELAYLCMIEAEKNAPVV